MGQEFRYSLTRICLRTGQLSLSRGMAEVFPDSGTVVVEDSLDGREVELTAVAPRRLAGIDEFLRRHRLQVNDTIQIRVAKDGRISLTALPRQRPRGATRSSTSDLLDDIFSRAPLSEAEIRELHPGLDKDFDLHRALQDDPRFRLRGGRWHGVSATTDYSEQQAPGNSEQQVPGNQESSIEPFEQPTVREDIPDDFGFDLADVFEPLGLDEASDGGSDDRQETAQASALSHDSTSDSGFASAEPASTKSASTESASSESAPTDPASPEPALLNEGAASREGAALGDPAAPPEEATEPGDQHSFAASDAESAPKDQFHLDRPAQDRRKRRPEGPAASQDRARERERRSKERERVEPRHAPVTPYPRGVMFPGEGALNSKRPVADLQSVNRAREALSSFGYTVEGLPHGMLLARAELGRKQHSVLIRVLSSGERLDWAALLARRRDHTADYLAVFGDHRDLHRLTAPADLARATLWSWEGVDRVRSLAASVRIGPYDLEPHFEKGGMFGPGLHKFERSVGRYVSERGVFSAVLTRLAALRAPSVFVLEDLVEGELSRDQVANALQILGGAPFHLVARVDKGEYCLRHRVDEGLQQLSDYALSLSARLPRVRHERLSGLAADPAEEQIAEQAEDVTA